MNAEASKLVVEIAREFIQLIISTELDWVSGYLRFRSEKFKFGSTASIEHCAGVEILSTLRNGDFFDSINETCLTLIHSMSNSAGVFLVIVYRNFDYEIKFEWENLERWKISKINGATGIPEDI